MDPQIAAVEQLPPASTPPVNDAQPPPSPPPPALPPSARTAVPVTAHPPVESNTETFTPEAIGNDVSPLSNPVPADNPPAQDPPVQEPLPESRPQSPHPPSPELEHAYWAEFEEDTSVPDEAEMKEIEAAVDAPNYSASRYEHWEKTIFPDLEDPEYQPVQKARVSWKIKGVRGTKDRPNRAKIMRSPPAYIGGYWWTIKFFPRGNNSSSMSIYYECSPTMPSPDKTLPETEFRVLSGAPDAVLDHGIPDLDLKFDKTDDSTATAWLDHYKSQYPPAARKGQEETRSKDSWRVPAQIGMVLYNPDEPRTGWFQTACHQFNSHNLDWGWTNFHGPWDTIHCRQRGQRQPMLRNDTLAFDAYIRLIDDPTRFLWWHPSPTEPVWDSTSLTGYRPLGESVISHSAEVAGLAAWLHVAPFCKIIQSVDVLEHLANCEVKPRPLCDALQKVLWHLRCHSESLEYVDINGITSTLCNLHEYSTNVPMFFERLRRSIELELAGTDAGKEFAKLFDSPALPETPPGSTAVNNALPRDLNSRICIPADQSQTIHEGLDWYLSAKPGRWALPPFLHVELDRQKLDRVARQWQLLYNRVELDEELDLSPWVQEGQSGHYTLYGYVVHRGRRSSSQHFSVLRPGGPGTRWLAFDDSSRNRVECLTRKAAFGSHLGLESSKKPDEKSGHNVAVLVMYIRSDLVGEFLPGPQELWDVPEPMKEYYETGKYPFKKSLNGESAEQDVQVEVYSLPQYDQLDSLFDTYDLMSRAKPNNNVMYLTMPRSSTHVELRKKIALWKSSGTEPIPSEHVRLWKIGRSFSRVWDLNNTLDVPSKVLRFWMQVVSNDDAKYFAMPDPPKPAPISEQKPEEAIVERSGSESPDDRQSDSEADATPTVSTRDTPEPNTNSEAVPATDEQPTEQPVEQPLEQPPPEDANNGHAEQHATQPEEPSAPNPLSSESASSNNPPEGADNDAVIAAIIANDIEEMESAAPAAATPPAAEAQNEPTPENTSTQQEHPAPPSEEPASEPTAAPTEPTEPAPAVLLLVQEQPTTEVAQTQSTNEDQPAASGEPEVRLPVDHVYYFIQIFDVDNQVLRTVGSFFSGKDENIKAALRKHLAWPDEKEFSIWQRVDGTSVTTASPSKTFSGFVPDGSCFIVGDRLKKNKQNELNQAGLAGNPERLLQCLWGVSRRHPIQAFTGFKTIEPTFTGSYYSGEFKNGLYHGRGKHISDLAAIYEGDFVSGRRQGKGTMEYPNGDTYEGDWFEDERHGQGTFVERKTGNKYIGGYKDGKRHGKGISYWEVADEEMDLCQICYGEEQDALFYDCGHVCACVDCARQVDICPICRKNVLNVVKIYRA